MSPVLALATHRRVLASAAGSAALVAACGVGQTTQQTTIAVDMLGFKSKQYGLPIGLSTSAMMYNADLFAKAGVPLPDGGWDWKQFVDVTQRLTMPAHPPPGPVAPGHPRHPSRAKEPR